jgi:hypothetical protein
MSAKHHSLNSIGILVTVLAVACAHSQVLAGDRSGGAGSSTLASVPSEFHGAWASDPSGSGFDTDDGRLLVKARKIEGWEWSGDVVSVRSIGPRTIVVKSKGFAEGEPIDSELTLELSDDGSVLLTKYKGSDGRRAVYRARGG